MSLDRQMKKYMEAKLEENVPNPYGKKKTIKVKKPGLPLWAKICIPVTAVAVTLGCAVGLINFVIGNNLEHMISKLNGCSIDMENVAGFAVCNAPTNESKTPKLTHISKLHAPEEEPDDSDDEEENNGEEYPSYWTEEELELYKWEQDYDWDPTKANVLVTISEDGKIDEVIYERTNNSGVVRQDKLGNCVAVYVSNNFTYAMYVNDSEYQFWTEINFAQELRYFNGFHCHHEEMQTLVIHNATGKVYALKDIFPQLNQISGAKNYTMQAQPTKDDFLSIVTLYGRYVNAWFKVLYDEENGVTYKYILPIEDCYRRLGVAHSDKYGQMYASDQVLEWTQTVRNGEIEGLKNCSPYERLDDILIFNENEVYYGNDNRVYIFQNDKLKVFKENYELEDVDPNISVSFEGFSTEFFDNGARQGGGYVYHFEQGYLYSMFGQVWKMNEDKVLIPQDRLEGSFPKYADDGYLIGGELIAIINTHELYSYSLDGELAMIQFGLKDGVPSANIMKIMDASELEMCGHRMVVLQDELPNMQRGPTKYYIVTVANGRPYANYVAYGDHGGMIGLANPVTEPLDLSIS